MMSSIFLPGTSSILTLVIASIGTNHAISSKVIYPPFFLSKAHLVLYMKTMVITKKRGCRVFQRFFFTTKQWNW